jgi:hypothetical protein
MFRYSTGEIPSVSSLSSQMMPSIVYSKGCHESKGFERSIYSEQNRNNVSETNISSRTNGTSVTFDRNRIPENRILKEDLSDSGIDSINTNKNSVELRDGSDCKSVAAAAIAVVASCPQSPAAESTISVAVSTGTLRSDDSYISASHSMHLSFARDPFVVSNNDIDNSHVDASSNNDIICHSLFLSSTHLSKKCTGSVVDHRGSVSEREDGCMGTGIGTTMTAQDMILVGTSKRKFESIVEAAPSLSTLGVDSVELKLQSCDDAGSSIVGTRQGSSSYVVHSELQCGNVDNFDITTDFLF